MIKKIKKEVMLLVLLLLMPSILALDSDRDGINDENDLYPFDFDNDQMPDKWELQNNLPHDRVNDKEDPDKDGLSNLEEFQKRTNPLLNDTDGDKIDDYTETIQKTDPTKKNKTIWPLIVFPILIILFVLILFLLKKYKLLLLLFKEETKLKKGGK
jgi:hypothetical protein